MNETNKLRELLCYGMYISGEGFDERKIVSIRDIDLELISVLQEKLDNINLELVKEALNRKDNLNLDYIEHLLTKQLYQIQELAERQNKRVTLLFSGGVDSTLLGILMKKIGMSFELLNLSYDTYTESEHAEKVAKEVLKMPIKKVHISREQLIADLPEILKLMPSPYERGSVLMSYYLMQHAKDIVVTGDSADCLFTPSFEKEIKGIELGVFNHEYISQEDCKKLGLKHPLHYFDDVIIDMLTFNAINEQPNYNLAKYLHFKKPGQIVVLPYFHQNLFSYSISCKTLHKQPRKYYLKELASKYTDMNFSKTAFKVERTSFSEITEEFFDDEVLKKNFNVSINDLETKDKIMFMIALYRAWCIANDRQTN